VEILSTIGFIRRRTCCKFSFKRLTNFFVAKPLRTKLFNGRNSEPDRGGLLFLCQEQSTDKIKFISTGCTGTPFRQMLS
jgi:hypothetical protein